MTKLESLMEDFGRALHNLEDALEEPVSDLVHDASIQRFEILFELGWKTAKSFLHAHHNAVCTSPRSCFQECFKHGVLSHDPFWIDVTVLRNYTTHTYSVELAQFVYERLPEVARRFRVLYKDIESVMAV